MKPTEMAGQFEVVPISATAELNEAKLGGAITTYRNSFGGPPYREAYTPDEAVAALTSSLERGGDLRLGMLGGQVVAIAAGYPKPDGSFYIEELAVDTDKQGRGYGRQTLNSLLASDNAQAAGRLEVRTRADNVRALNLYRSVGFEQEAGPEVATSWRQNGQPALDARVYLSKPPLSEQERQKTLKRVAVACPSGNTTAIVFDQLLDLDRKDLNAKVIQAADALGGGQSGVEQCCFVTLPCNPEAVARVQMFGDEFCGNATRSVAWLVTQGRDYQGKIEVSGVDHLLDFSVQNGEVTLEMPLPESAQLTQQVREGMLVQLDGIAQLVVTEPQGNQSPRELLTALLRTNAYGLRDQPAVGVSYYDKASAQANFCVWVNEVDTVYDETACGSGTCAIGVALATDRKATTKLNVVQPSGELIRTEATYGEKGVSKSSIAGRVNILYDGELALA